MANPRSSTSRDPSPKAAAIDLTAEAPQARDETETLVSGGVNSQSGNELTPEAMDTKIAARLEELATHKGEEVLAEMIGGYLDQKTKYKRFSAFAAQAIIRTLNSNLPVESSIFRIMVAWYLEQWAKVEMLSSLYFALVAFDLGATLAPYLSGRDTDQLTFSRQEYGLPLDAKDEVANTLEGLCLDTIKMGDGILKIVEDVSDAMEPDNTLIENMARLHADSIEDYIHKIEKSGNARWLDIAKMLTSGRVSGSMTSLKRTTKRSSSLDHLSEESGPGAVRKESSSTEGPSVEKLSEEEKLAVFLAKLMEHWTKLETQKSLILSGRTATELLEDFLQGDAGPVDQR
jgi:hypothetical protein